MMRAIHDVSLLIPEIEICAGATCLQSIFVNSRPLQVQHAVTWAFHMPTLLTALFSRL